jgi:hypothetical protein
MGWSGQLQRAYRKDGDLFGQLELIVPKWQLV